jgi:hypothetical protein
LLVWLLVLLLLVVLWPAYIPFLQILGSETIDQQEQTGHEHARKKKDSRGNDKDKDERDNAA